MREVALPRRVAYHPSPSDWRDQVIYFLLPDRFSDGQEGTRPALDVAQRDRFRPAGWRWDQWASSGGARYQGGTIAGATSKLGYLKSLGVTTLWVAPVFKQRRHLDTFHGYAIQDFLEVDPRLGTRQDLVDLVAAAHAEGMYVLLDVVFNHTGDNWVYPGGVDGPPYLPWPQSYPLGAWLDAEGGLVDTIAADDDGVWPVELQSADYYTRAGQGSLGAGGIDDPHAEFRRSDFFGDRDINFDGTRALDDLARCYKHWIALSDCDGFRIDTVKHVDQETARNFCGTIKEFASNLGKADFFLVAEVAGADSDAERYLRVLGSNLNATLDIGQARPLLTAVAKGLAPPDGYFSLVEAWTDTLGSHRDSGSRHVSILDDHDHVSGVKLRFSTGAANDHQVVAGVALQLFTLGVPCIYYGTEQAFAGPERSVTDQFLPDFGSSDKFLREAMFGPTHPRVAGGTDLDPGLPGFGPFGTSGAHSFDASGPAFVRIAALLDARRRFPVLRQGREYPRPISNYGALFSPPAGGELIAWSRILDDEEALCIVNGHGLSPRGGDVVVDAGLNDASAPGAPWKGAAPYFTVIANTAQAFAGAGYGGSLPVGARVPVSRRGDGTAYVAVRDVGPSEVLVLDNRG